MQYAYKKIKNVYSLTFTELRRKNFVTFFLTKAKLKHLIDNQECNIYDNFITILDDSDICNHP